MALPDQPPQLPQLSHPERNLHPNAHLEFRCFLADSDPAFGTVRLVCERYLQAVPSDALDIAAKAAIGVRAVVQVFPVTY